MDVLSKVSSKHVGSLRSLLRVLRKLNVISGYRIELDYVPNKFDGVDMSSISVGLFSVLLEYPSDDDETIDNVNTMLERIFYSDPGFYWVDHSGDFDDLDD